MKLSELFDAINVFSDKTFTIDNRSNKLVLVFYPNKPTKDLIRILTFYTAFLVVIQMFDIIKLLMNISFSGFLLITIVLLVFYILLPNLWVYFGKEEVRFTTRELTVTRSIFYLQSKMEFLLDDIESLTIGVRRTDENGEYLKNTSIKETNGIFHFIYKGKLYDFGLDVEVDDAYMIYQEIADITRFSDLDIRLD